MDMTQFMKPNYVTIDLVKSSPTKKGVILNSGEVKDVEGKKRVIILVSIDEQTTDWTLNRPTIKNFSEAWGIESKKWVEKVFSINIETVNGKEYIIGKKA